MLPWVVMANIVVTVAGIFILRVFAVGQWAEQQKQLATAVERLSGQLEEANQKIAQLTLKIAVMSEKITQLERGGAGRD